MFLGFGLRYGGLRTGMWIIASVLLACWWNDILTIDEGIVSNHGVRSKVAAALATCRRGFTSSSSHWQQGGWSSAKSQGLGHDEFSYKAAVAFEPKERESQQSEAAKSPTGEDSFFVAQIAPALLYAGVADGVGGWANMGYDSSAISRELCKAVAGFAAKAGDGTAKSPKSLLGQAFNDVCENGEVKVGSTTAVVARLGPDGKLEVANLGDSWCGVFRESKLVFETKYQTVGFNAPYQLSIIPDKILHDAEARGSKYITNDVSDADEYSFQLKKDDIILLSTDGVVDNIDTQDIEIFLKDNSETMNTDLQKVTETFVSKVVQLSRDPNFPSVFSQALSKLTGKEYNGGKEDDITVVMIKVEKQS